MGYRRQKTAECTGRVDYADGRALMADGTMATAAMRGAEGEAVGVFRCAMISLCLSHIKMQGQIYRIPAFRQSVLGIF